MTAATVGSDDFPKANTLRNRTFIGLLIAQFLAAFNDQAIHASAMFFAIHKKTLTEEKAISLMPILFFAPWAIFATLAGYYADKYSKRFSLVLWKFSEIGITALALLGFYLGSEMNMPNTGVWIVLFTVFLMGTHSTFFVPAKYGVMPEILSDELMSKGNGVLEMLSFLATILGTVMGGVLSLVFHDDEYLIGLILFVLAVVGAAASLLIRRMKPANPDRPFPRLIYMPLIANLRLMIRSRPLRFVLVGIAFFTFMLAFMRAAVYMLGESRIPRWNELKTSAVVGMTALGIGLGSPMAGWLSGKKVELGLVPIGAIGMVILICLAALMLNVTWALIACIVFIGFFTGFYLVPLFTQQQHRAPKKMKGEIIATSNFTNVLGAITASILFYFLVWLAHVLNLSPRFEQDQVYTNYILKHIFEDRFNHPKGLRLASVPHAPEVRIGIQGPHEIQDAEVDLFTDDAAGVDVQILISQKAQVSWNDQVTHHLQGGIEPRLPVHVTKYTVNVRGREIPHFYVRRIDEPMDVQYDNRDLPRFLFLGAALLTLAVFLILMTMLPDLLWRTGYVLRSLHKPRLSVAGILNLPGDGPVILATNASTSDQFDALSAASDRQVFVAPEGTDAGVVGTWIMQGKVVAIPTSAQSLLEKLCSQYAATLVLLPTWVGPARVKFGTPISTSTPVTELHAAIKQVETTIGI